MREQSQEGRRESVIEISWCRLEIRLKIYCNRPSRRLRLDVDRVESCDTRRIQKINVHRTAPSGVSRGLANFSVTINERWARWLGTPPRLDASNGADLVRTIAADTTTYRKKLVSFGPIEGVGTANTVNSFSIGTRKSSLNTATRRYKLREKCSITRKLALT